MGGGQGASLEDVHSMGGLVHMLLAESPARASQLGTAVRAVADGDSAARSGSNGDKPAL